jgi:predicted MFS family arabinose efflux permease
MKKNIFLSVTFIQIFVLYFFYFTGYSALNMLPPYLSSIGAGKAFIAFFINVPSLEIFFFVILCGRFSNKINRKRALICGYIAGIIATILMFIFSDNLAVLLFLRIITGVSFVFSFSMIANYVFDMFPKEERSSGIALFGVSAVISTPTGTFIAEKMLSLFHPKYLFLLAALLYLVTMIITAFITEPPHGYHGKESKSFLMILKRKDLLRFLLIALIAGGIMSVFITFIPGFSRERLGNAKLTFFFLPSAMVAIVMRTFMRRLFDRISKIKMITFSFFCLFTALLLMLFLSKEYQLLVMGFLYGFGYSTVHPILSSIFVDRGTEDEKVILNNTYLSVNTFGNIMITTGLGFLGDIFGTVFIFISAVIIITAGIVITMMPGKLFCDELYAETEII